MQYSLLIYESEASLALRADPARQQSYTSGFIAYTVALREAGVFVGGSGLQLPATATTVRLGDARPTVQDGPYADTKEQLGGFYLIEVPDLDAALAWAARVPAAPGSVIEVRPTLMPPSSAPAKG